MGKCAPTLCTEDYVYTIYGDGYITIYMHVYMYVHDACAQHSSSRFFISFYSAKENHLRIKEMVSWCLLFHSTWYIKYRVMYSLILVSMLRIMIQNRMFFLICSNICTMSEMNWQWKIFCSTSASFLYVGSIYIWGFEIISLVVIILTSFTEKLYIYIYSLGD